MAKFLIIGDLHLRTTTPAMRTEADFLHLCLGKLEWLVQHAIKHECDAILQPGDFFDSPNPTTRLLVNTIAVLRESVPVITVPGNHDVAGKNTDLYVESGIGILEAAEVLKVLRLGDSIELEDCVIYGYGYGEASTEEIIKGKGKKQSDKFEIGLLHASVGDSRQVAQYDIHELNVKGLDLAVFGDIHDGFEPVRHKSGCLSVNMGSVIRTNANEVDQIPTCMIFDTTDGSYEYFTIPHPDAKYSFKLEEIDARSADRVEAWEAAHARSIALKSEKPEDLVLRIGNEMGYDDGTIALVLSALAEVRK